MGDKKKDKKDKKDKKEKKEKGDKKDKGDKKKDKKGKHHLIFSISITVRNRSDYTFRNLHCRSSV